MSKETIDKINKNSVYGTFRTPLPEVMFRDILPLPFRNSDISARWLKEDEILKDIPYQNEITGNFKKQGDKMSEIKTNVVEETLKQKEDEILNKIEWRKNGQKIIEETYKKESEHFALKLKSLNHDLKQIRKALKVVKGL